LALLLALVSRENERQANVPMFEAPNLSRGIVHNVSAYCVAGLGALVKWPSAMTSATCCKIVPRD
jgi:hypothetical protein